MLYLADYWVALKSYYTATSAASTCRSTIQLSLVSKLPSSLEMIRGATVALAEKLILMTIHFSLVRMVEMRMHSVRP